MFKEALNKIFKKDETGEYVINLGVVTFRFGKSKIGEHGSCFAIHPHLRYWRGMDAALFVHIHFGGEKRPYIRVRNIEFSHWAAPRWKDLMKYWSMCGYHVAAFTNVGLPAHHWEAQKSAFPESSHRAWSIPEWLIKTYEA